MEQNHLCNFERGHNGEHTKFEPVIQEMSFKDISYIELWQPLCSVDWNLCAILEEGFLFV